MTFKSSFVSTRDLAHSAPQAASASKSNRGMVNMMLSRVSGMAAGLASSSILGRLLTPSDYGLVAMALSAMVLLNLFKDFGLTTALIQSGKLTDDQVDAIFWINLGTTVFVAVVGMLAAPAIASFYGEPPVRDILIVLCLGLVLTNGSATHGALMRRNLTFGPLMWSEMIGQFVGLAVGVGAALLWRSYWAIVASSLTSALASSLVIFLGLRWIPGWPAEFRSAGQLAKFGANLSLFSLLSYLSNQLGSIIIGAYLGASSAGHFNRAQQMLSLSGSVLMQPISQVVLPVLSRMQEDRDGYRQYYLAVLQRTAFLFSCLGGFVVLEGGHLTRILLGPNWPQAGAMFRWFGLAVAAVGMASHTGNVLMSQGRIRELRNWGVGDAVIRAGSSLIGLTWGAEGVAAGFGVSTLFITVPIVCAIIGRRGPVSFADQMRVIIPAATSLFLAISVGLCCQWVFPDLAMAASLAVSLAISMTAAGVVAVLHRPTWDMIAAAAHLVSGRIWRRTGSDRPA